VSQNSDENYMKLLIKYCLLVGLLVFISCDPGKKNVHQDIAFPKKIDPNVEISNINSIEDIKA